MSKRIGGGSGHDATPQAMINDPSLFLFAPTQLSCAPAYQRLADILVCQVCYIQCKCVLVGVVDVWGP